MTLNKLNCQRSTYFFCCKIRMKTAKSCNSRSYINQYKHRSGPWDFLSNTFEEVLGVVKKSKDSLRLNFIQFSLMKNFTKYFRGYISGPQALPFLHSGSMLLSCVRTQNTCNLYRDLCSCVNCVSIINNTSLIFYNHRYIAYNDINFQKNFDRFFRLFRSKLTMGMTPLITLQLLTSLEVF
jgi:hypothetical protein